MIGGETKKSIEREEVIASAAGSRIAQPPVEAGTPAVQLEESIKQMEREIRELEEEAARVPQEYAERIASKRTILEALRAGKDNGGNVAASLGRVHLTD